MSGALLQLAALSSQDVYLTGNPEITLFKKKYMRYTNFSVETVQVAFDGGSVSFSDTTTATLEKTGDLISRIVLVINLQQLTSTVKWGYVDKIGHAIIDYVRISIGQSEIDIRYNDWIDIYQRITKDNSQENNYNTMIGNVSSLKKLSYSHDAYNLFIPLEFWTGKISSSAFPICSLLNQNFQVSVKFRDAIDCINYFGTTAPSNNELPFITSGYLLVDYIYLEIEERNLFITNNHEYLIEVVDRMTDTLSAINTKINLTFNKPTKYMIWYAQLTKYAERSKFMSWATDDDWEKSRIEFAKLVWLITRQGLDTTDPNNPIINFGAGYVNIGTQPPIVVGGNTLFEALAAKVSAVILFASTDISGDVIANAAPDNVALITNTITFEDMSTTIDTFKADALSTATQDAFMDIYTNNIIDIFNYGNFINRSDNPIINSSFQLNGKNRFQERDGFFYNYLQSYYYFKNSPKDGVNIYTFSLYPEELQPSGTINLGNVNSKDLLVTLGKYNAKNDNYLSYFNTGNIRIFALGYNNLKIFRGVAGLAY
uniref:Major capsid protein N-terminal domain-containing protein n=1 Tax=viral metagenome TaxID=1070528 RepID=A0A6C0HUR9_9ZZZZ